MKDIVNINIAEYKKYIPPGLYTLLKNKKKLSLSDLLKFLNTYLSEEEKNIFFKVFYKKEKIDLSKIDFNNEQIALFKENYIVSDNNDEKDDFLISIIDIENKKFEKKDNIGYNDKQKENIIEKTELNLKKEKIKERSVKNEKCFFDKSGEKF